MARSPGDVSSPSRALISPSPPHTRSATNALRPKYPTRRTVAPMPMTCSMCGLPSKPPVAFPAALFLPDVVRVANGNNGRIARNGSCVRRFGDFRIDLPRGAALPSAHPERHHTELQDNGERKSDERIQQIGEFTQSFAGARPEPILGPPECDPTYRRARVEYRKK